MKSILVTGGAGFIGSNLIPYFINKYPDYKLINLDKLTYAGSLDNLRDCEGASNYVFIHGDICDAELLKKLFHEYDIRGVVHLAAESHVDNSISGPAAFIETNIVGTFKLLAAAREHWMDAPGVYKQGYEGSRFHHVSTDEVFGSLGAEGVFSETTPYAPNSPYSASKASSDFIVRSYHHTYGLDVVTSNCSNNYGPKQHSEKFIPTIIRKALAGEAIPIYGQGSNIRDWLYVSDHCKAIDLIYHKGASGETYNVGGRNERTNLQVAQKICALLDEIRPREAGCYKDLLGFVVDRPGHDFRYAIDCRKLEQNLGWKASEDFESNFRKTVAWYLEGLAIRIPVIR